MTESGQLAAAGGPAYLHDLIASIPDLGHVAHYAGIVAERSQLRQLMEAGVRIARLAAMPSDNAPGRDVDDVVDLARRTVLDVTNSV